MSANFTPVMGEYKSTGSFRFWCQKVLPSVYDDSLSYYELLCKVVNTLNNVIENVDTVNENTVKLANAYQKLESYVNDYFDNLDVQNEVNTKLDEMANSGELGELISVYIGDVVNATKRRYLFIGDSYASHPNTFTNKSWRGYLIEYLGLTEGVDAFSSYKGSTGFVATLADGTNFITLVENADVSIEDDLITDIVVVGGYNDYPYEIGVIRTGITNFKLAAKNRFQNAKIWLGMPGWSMDEPAITGCRNLWNNWVTICPPLGISLLTDVYPALHLYLTDAPVFNADVEGGRFHPNDYGSQMIAEAAFENLMGSRWNNSIGNRSAILNSDTGWSISGGSIITDSKQGFKRLWFYRLKFSKSDGVSVNYESSFKLGKLENVTILPSNTISVQTMAKFNIATIGTTYKPITLLLYQNGDLEMRINEIGSTFTNYTQVDIYDALFVVDKFNT